MWSTIPTPWWHGSTQKTASCSTVYVTRSPRFTMLSSSEGRRSADNCQKKSSWAPKTSQRSSPMVGVPA